MEEVAKTALQIALSLNEFVQLPTAQIASATFKQKIPSLLAITTWRIQPANAIKS